MSECAARTILSLNDKRDEAIREKQSVMLELAQVKHHLNMLKHMKYEIEGCLLEYRRPSKTHPDSASACRHALSRIERILRNG